MGDRIIHWKQHGDSFMCEKHYQEYRKKFRHLIGSAERVKPDERFSEKGAGKKVPESPQLEQLEL